VSLYMLTHLHIFLVYSSSDTTPPEIYTLSLHDALPILSPAHRTARRSHEVLHKMPAVEEHQREHANEIDADFAGRHLVQYFMAADRKSTRLNSSHLGISYAVFCLKKKKKL